VDEETIYYLLVAIR